MEILDPKLVHEINCKLAYEIISSRLDAPTTHQNVEKLARFIEELESNGNNGTV